MKFAFFDDYELGVVSGGRIRPLEPRLDLGTGSPQARLEALVEGYERLAPAIHEIAASDAAGPAVGDVRLRPPVPRPTQIVCAFRNYFDNRPRSDIDFFLKSPLSVVGDGDEVVLPDVAASKFQHEPELAAVIGRRVHSPVPEASALDCVFGYTGFIDVSARDIGVSYYRRKSYRTFGPMGPLLVTADEFGDPHAVRTRLWVNGELRQDFSTGQMACTIADLVADASRVTGFEVGDVLSTGTYHIGMGNLRDGDVVVQELEGIGRLTVTVRDPAGRRWEDDTGEATPAGGVP